MEYLKVKNWEEYQHYKDRNPPWIKLHVRILKDRKFISLSSASRGLLMQLWILASEHGGEIPYDLDEIQFQLRDDTVTMDQLNVLIDKGFLKNCKQELARATTMQADAVPETETETETEEEKEPPPSAGPFFSDEQVKKAEKLCNTLQNHFKKNFWPWVKQCEKSGCRPEHVVYCLEQLWEYRQGTKDPWPYLNHIMQITHQNQNEHEAISEHDARKAEELGFDPRGIVEVLQKNRGKG